MNLFSDVRAGLRLLRKHPGFALTASLTLALGIGATTALFSIVDAVLLRPLPYRDEGRLVTLWQTRPGAAGREETSPGVFLDWRDRVQSFERIAAIEPYGHAMTGTGEPERFRSWLVTEGFFDILGTAPLYGRTFLPEEHVPGKSAEVVLGNALWKQRFGGDPGWVGRTLVLNGKPHTIVGIMPPGFQYPPGRDLWGPREPRPWDAQVRGATYIKVIGRLKPGVTVGSALAEMQAIGTRLAAELPHGEQAFAGVVVPLRQALVGNARRGLLVLFGAVGFVLLIACANVAGLFLARGARRTRELAIRAALGAGRGRLVRHLLMEGLVLAACGGVGGVILAYWLADALVALAPMNLPGLDRVGVDPAACAFAAGASLLSGLLFGLLPALRLTGPSLQDTLKEEGRAAAGGGGRHGMRQTLIVAEMALAVVLLAGAGLLVRSFTTLMRVDPGFVAENGLTLEVQLGRNITPAQMRDFAAGAEERLRAIPGVRQAGLTTALPFHDNQIVIPTTLTIPSRVVAAGNEPTAYFIAATPGYLPALGVPVVSGRAFTPFDGPDATRVALINRTLQRRVWPSDDPLGQRISFDASGERTECEIVGVVGDVRPEGLDSEPRAEVYVPYAQAPVASVTWLVRTAADPLASLPAVKEQIRSVRPAQPFASIATLDQWIERSLLSRRFNLYLLAAFAGLALLLAAVGLYSLISYTLAQRTREIGVRMALGAQGRDILQLIIGQGMGLALTGAIAGLAAALALTRSLRGLLYGVSPADPLTFAGVLAVLLTVAFLAALVPGVRASRLDPTVALRRE